MRPGIVGDSSHFSANINSVSDAGSGTAALQLVPALRPALEPFARKVSAA